MAFVNPVPGKPYLKKDTKITGDVSSVVGLTGIKNGAISISFEKACILKVVSNMFGEDMKELDASVSDAVGEIANMISGQARRDLEGMGFLLHGAIPTVFIGSNHEITHITDGPKIAIPFTVDNSKFTFEVCMEN
ncbi:MAG: chemotaxis protein CheX [Desulfobacterales bacterium]|nr:chemotaxis protein CheX [Desulfobacterales bacterium]